MAKIKNLKRDIDYLVSEIISDCYTCLAIGHSQKSDEVFEVIAGAVEMRNNLFDRVNHPAEKHNPRLVKKHYAQIRLDMFLAVDELFIKLSDACKK